MGQGGGHYIEIYSHFAGALIVGEDPPQASNRIILHPTERDQHSLPVPIIEYTMHPNSYAMQRHGINQTTQL